GTSTTRPTARGAPFGRMSTTTSRTRPTWSPMGSNTLVPARRATKTVVAALTRPAYARAGVTARSSRHGPRALRASRTDWANEHVTPGCRPPCPHPAARGADRVLRDLPRGAEGRRLPVGQQVRGRARDDRGHRPQ